MNFDAKTLNKILATWIQQYVQRIYTLTREGLFLEYEDDSTYENQSV